MPALLASLLSNIGAGVILARIQTPAELRRPGPDATTARARERLRRSMAGGGFGGGRAPGGGGAGGGWGPALLPGRPSIAARLASRAAELRR